MISQNFSETDDDHGYLEWNILNGDSHFHKLKNEYAYHKIDIDVSRRSPQMRFAASTPQQFNTDIKKSLTSNILYNEINKIINDEKEQEPKQDEKMKAFLDGLLKKIKIFYF